MSTAENITFKNNISTTRASFEQIEVRIEEATILSEPKENVPSRKKKEMRFTTDISTEKKQNGVNPSPPPPPPAPVTFSSGDLSDRSLDQKRKEELQRRLAAMSQAIAAFSQYVETQAIEESAEASSKPNLTPDPSPEVKKAARDIMGYMLALMNAMILSMENQAKVGKNSTEMSETTLKLAKDQLEKAKTELDKLTKDEYNAAHRSFWAKMGSAFKAMGHIFVMASPAAIFGYMAGHHHNISHEYKSQFKEFCKDNMDSGGMFTILIAVAMIAAAPFCGGTSLALMGAFMIVMQQSGGQEALNNAIAKSGPLGLQILLQVVVAVVEAVALAGVGGIIDSVAAQLTTNGAKAAANGVTEAGEEEAGIEMVALRNGAVEASETTATEIDSATASQSTLQQILKDAARRAFGEDATRSIIGKTLMQAGSSSLWSNLIRGIIEVSKKSGAHVSKGEEDDACAIAGAVLGAIGAMCGALLDAGAGSADLARKLSEKLGEKAFDSLKTTIGAMTSLFTLQQSIYLVQVGLQKFDLGETLKHLSITQGTQTLLSDILDRIQVNNMHNNSSMNSLAQDNNAVSRRMDTAFVWDLV